MKNAFALGSLIAVVTCLAGCGSDPDSLMKQQIALMNETADAIESGASESELEALEKRGNALEEKMEKLNLTEEQSRELFERHKEELSKALARFLKAGISRSAKMGEGFPGMPGGNGLPNPLGD